MQYFCVMFKGLLRIIAFLFLFTGQQLSSQDLGKILVSKTPAKHFTEAMPLGNGRIGAMVFGNLNKERIALNEISLWSGGPQDADKDSANIYLKPIQQLLLQGKNKEAQELLMKHFVAKGNGTGNGQGAKTRYGSYQTAGNLIINWKGNSDDIKDYHNVLNLDDATGTTTYIKNGIAIEQKIFADFKNDILWIKISSQQSLPEFEITLERKENVTSCYTKGESVILKGQLPNGPEKGIDYLVAAHLVKCNGNTSFGENSIKISQAREVVIAVDVITNYNYVDGGFKKDYDLEKIETQKLAEFKHQNFENAQKLSSEVYKSQFNRSKLVLNSQRVNQAVVTGERLENFKTNGYDPKLLELYFNFGKYLLISSSRPGLLPANLQGVWAEEYQAPWNGDYHLNINLQMNYWPAETLNLSELAEPLFRFTKNLVGNGSKTAQKYYGAKGWVAHVVSNPWFFTSPGEGAEWGSTLTGGAWLTTHLWEHYRFTQDTAFLKNYYPIIKSSSEFLKDILIEEPNHHYLVTAPSNSPENTYIMPNGFRGNTCMGPTMDMQIARNIFSAVTSSSKILKTDLKYGHELELISNRLAPNQISKLNGGIQEWLHDWPSAEPQHRHVSHLFGLYPYDEISPSTPEFFNAAKQTLLLRGDGGTGWSKAWKINFWARLHDGDHAFAMLKSLLNPVYYGGKSQGGTYPNLFDAHPPFQIDGNFGAIAGMAEMLLQSHGTSETIRLLPALPKDENFRSGYFEGFKARGNFEISCRWKDFKITEAKVISKSGRPLRIIIPENRNLYYGNKNISNGRKEIFIKTHKGQIFMIK